MREPTRRDSRLRWWLVPVAVAFGSLVIDGAVVAFDTWTRHSAWSVYAAELQR